MSVRDMERIPGEDARVSLAAPDADEARRYQEWQAAREHEQRQREAAKLRAEHKVRWERELEEENRRREEERTAKRVEALKRGEVYEEPEPEPAADLHYMEASHYHGYAGSYYPGGGSVMSYGGPYPYPPPPPPRPRKRRWGGPPGGATVCL